LPREMIDVALYSVSPDRGHAHFLPDLEKLGVVVHDLSRARVGNTTLPTGAARLAAALPGGLRSDMIALWHLANEIRPDVIHGWQDRSALAAGLVAQLLQIAGCPQHAQHGAARPDGSEPGPASRALPRLRGYAEHDDDLELLGRGGRLRAMARS
jgi:hypothetical protein